MARALITGASGFIGHHLAEALVERGDDVIGLVRTNSRTAALEELGIQLERGDITQPASLAGPCGAADVVYHLAGLTRSRTRHRFAEVNEQGARNVAVACAAADIPPVLINVSSLAAAGPATGGIAKREHDRPSPVSMYGASKLAGERAVARVADQVAVTIVRPPIVFGERDTALLAMARPIRRSRIHVVPGLTKKIFSLIHAQELVALLMQVAESGERLDAGSDDTSRGIYFAECERRLSCGEIGAMIADSLGHRCLCVPLPHAVIYCVGAVAELATLPFGFVPTMNMDKAREATAGSWICDAGKAASQLNFEVAEPVSERIRQTLDWYQDHKWL